MKFIENRKKLYILSLVVILVGLLAMPYHAFIKGDGMLNYDIEFRGGTVMQLEIGQPFDINKDIKPLVVEHLGDDAPRIQMVTGKQEILVTTKPTEVAQRESLVKAIQEKYNMETTPLLSENFVSPSISPEIKSKAIQAIVLGSILMLVYISVRFKDFKFGASAVLALVHDVLVMLAVYSIFRIPINNSFIAAMLTVIGYSNNDTIIVFDRIRENRGRMKGDDTTLINTSINQTITRSIYTSLTTLIMVGLLFIIGVGAVKAFAFPLVIGIATGTYSSIFVASPILYELRQWERKRKQNPKKKPEAKAKKA
ncbi:MAG: protein translocase subunit SecF [Cellulosilyticaceae bacterium]